MEYIGRKATGTRWDRRGGRISSQGEYKFGYMVKGVIVRYDKPSRKYEIEGTKYIITPEGTFKDGKVKELFFKEQVDLIVAKREREKDEKNNKPPPSDEPSEVPTNDTERFLALWDRLNRKIDKRIKKETS